MFVCDERRRTDSGRGVTRRWQGSAKFSGVNVPQVLSGGGAPTPRPHPSVALKKPKTPPVTTTGTAPESGRAGWPAACQPAGC